MTKAENFLTNLESLIQASRLVGNQPCYIQGGGGNTSIKYDETILIKASGSELKAMNHKQGFVGLNYPQALAYLTTVGQAVEEGVYTQAINKTVNDPHTTSWPSMESGFHVLIPHNVVVHTHSVYVNRLMCSKEYRALVKEYIEPVFKQVLVVDYVTPGKDLVLVIRDLCLKGSIDKTVPLIILLQNHGVIVADSTAEGALGIHEQLNLHLAGLTGGIDEGFLNLALSKSGEGRLVIGNRELDCLKDILFPDQLIYFAKSIAFEGANRSIVQAMVGIVEGIERKGYSLNTIALPLANKLLNLTSEQYRQRIIGQV